ncbi:hypothetical protein D3C84_824030 [compost metagenome]
MATQIERENLGKTRQCIDLCLPILPGGAQAMQQQNRSSPALANIGTTTSLQLNIVHGQHLFNSNLHANNNFHALLQLPSRATTIIRKHI